MQKRRASTWAWPTDNSGAVGEGIREYQAALRINPNDAEVRYGLSVMYEQQDRLVEARREARLALEMGCEPARLLLSMLGDSTIS